MSKRNLIMFGKKLKEYRNLRGFTQVQLAEKLGFSPNFIGMIERGERNTTIDKVYLIASILDIAPNKLFEK